MPDRGDLKKTRTLAEVENTNPNEADGDVELAGVLDDLGQYLDSSESEFEEPKRLVQKRRKTIDVPNPPKKSASFPEVQ